MQSVIAKDDEEKSVFDFASANWYDTDNSLLENSKIAYTTTIYFVETAFICEGGRDQEDFDYSGTGDSLWVKKKGRKDQLYQVPLTEDKTNNVS